MMIQARVAGDPLALGPAARQTIRSVDRNLPVAEVRTLADQVEEHFSEQRLATVLLPHDYLNYWLTGEKVMEYGDASGTALLDVRKRNWSSAVLEAIDPELAGKMPPVRESDKLAGKGIVVVSGRRSILVTAFALKPHDRRGAIDQFLQSFKLAR